MIKIMNKEVELYYYFTQIMTKNGKIQSSELERFSSFINFNKKRNLIQQLDNLRLYNLKND